MSDVRYLTALGAIKMVKEASLVGLEESDFEFLTQEKMWTSVDRARARRVVEAATFGAVDFMGFPRIQVPAEWLAATIATYVHPVNMMTACTIMDAAEWTENIINEISRPLSPTELFAHVMRVVSGFDDQIIAAQQEVQSNVQLGVQ
tara:strand:- start:1336 stop:1776 length:441 start_codon:yes stop_codon:yes gene_type:complete